MTLQEIVAGLVPKTKEQLADKARYRAELFQTTKGNTYPREKLYRQRLRWAMVKAYGGKCVECGEDDYVVLVLDHINDDAPVDRILNSHKGGYRMYAMLRRQGWPKDKHQLLCQNCNFRKEYYRRNGDAVEDEEAS